MPYVNHNKKTTWTREQVRHMLSTDQKWIEKAIVMLYRERQTTVEQSVKQTTQHNNIGFQQMDARFFSSIAEWIENKGYAGVPLGQRLTPRQLACVKKPWGKRGIPRVAKYARQVLAEIEAKASQGQ